MTLQATVTEKLNSRSFGFILDRISADYYDSEHVSEDDFLSAVLTQLAQWGNCQALADNARDDAVAALQSDTVDYTLDWWMDAAEALDILPNVTLTDDEQDRFFTDYLFNGHSDDALAMVTAKAREQEAGV